MQKKSLIILIIVLSVICIGILSIVGIILTGKFNFIISTKVSKDLTFEETYDATFVSVELISKEGEIVIKESEDDKINVKVYGKKKDYEVNSKDVTLKVELKKKQCKFICINEEIPKVEIYLPADFDRKIDITNKFGNIKGSNIENAYFKIENKYGNVELKGANEAKIDNKYGNIELGIVNNITIDNKFGNIEVYEVNEYLKITNKFGDIEITKVNLTKNSSIENKFGDVKISSTNEINIDAKNSLGDVKIKNNHKDADIKLKIDNDFGDIKVK